MKPTLCKAFLLFCTLGVSQLASQEVHFVEDFAIATDRGAVLEKLIPGTEDYYYFYSLHFQNHNELARVDELMGPWVKRFGNSSRAVEIQNRQALLKYDDDPEKTLAFLKRRLGLGFNHQREIPQAEQNLPTQLNAELIDPEKLVEQALRGSRNTDKIESEALALLATRNLNQTQRVHLLSRIQWPDFPNLVNLIEQELKDRNSRGFGRINIHNRLTQDQLDQLGQRMPKLRNQTNFVNAYMGKLRPSNDIDWINRLDEQTRFLDRLWSYVETLEPVHNSLKACIRYHQLRVEQRMGKYDRDKFLSYLKLPRRVAYANPDFIKRIRRTGNEVNLNADFRQQTSLVPIQNDEPLVRDYLHQFLKTKADLNEFAPYIESNYLKTQYATSNILKGQGDVETWASMLTPEAYKAIVERVDLEFAATNASLFKPADPVQLKLFTKNIDKLIVKIFEVNSENYYRRFGREIDTDINLDGLVPNEQLTFEYSEPPAKRVERKFEFPNLKDRSVYVIDFIGNGKSSRAIVRKGQLSFITRVTFAGHEFTIIDEEGKSVSDAEILIGGQLYEALKDDNGKPTNRILVPYSTQPRNQPVIIRQGNFASLDFFNHRRESYSLQAALHVDREALIRARKAQVVIRPQLRLSGTPVPVGLLENARLQITTTDLDGNSSTRTEEDLKLSEKGETIVEFQVPPRLRNVQFQLIGDVENMSVSSTQTTIAANQASINQIDGSDEIQDAHLLRSGSDFLFEIRGKSGELRNNQAVLVELKSQFVTQTIRVSLQSDENGIVQLGTLSGIDWVRATCAAGSTRSWNLEPDGGSRYRSIHSVVGNLIRVAAPPMLKVPNRQQISLFEIRDGKIVKDWFDSIAVSDGLVGLDELAAGDYQLVFKDTGQVTDIRVTDGEIVNSTILGSSRRLETRQDIPLHVKDIKTGDSVEIKLGGINPSTRVHVFATRYVPRFNALNQFLNVRDTEPYVIRPGIRRSTYMAGRKIGDEYQYILDRRYAKKFVGNMLERPSMLLNPFSISQAENRQNVLARGGQFGEAQDQSGSSSSAAPEEKRHAEANNDFANLDFLKEGTVVLANLRPDDDGVVRINPDKLGEKQYLVVVAADLFSTVQRSFATKAVAASTRDLRLVNAFDPETHVSQSKQVELLEPNAPFVIEDVLTAKFQSFDELGDIYQVLKALNPDQHLSQFAFILSWMDKDKAEKQKLYSQFACHELNFFIAKKDREFFTTVVKPYLASKREKTFIDHYLLGNNLAEFLKPWNFARLNSVERILLAQQMENQKADLLQHLEELYHLNPTTRVYAGRLYDSTIAAGTLFGRDSGIDTDFLERLKGKDQSKLPALTQSKNGVYFKRDGQESGQPVDRARKEIHKIELGAELQDARRSISAVEAIQLNGARGRIAGDAKIALDEVRAGEKSLANFSGRQERFYFEQNEDLEETDGDDDGKKTNWAVDKKLRKRIQQLYRRIAKTQEWIEQHYYKLLPQQHNADRVTMNRFWVDYANHRGGAPFISSHFAESHRNFTEMMFVLSVLDLPFKAKEHETEYIENQLRLTPGSPMIALHQQMRPTVVERRNTTVLVSENFFQKNDRYRHEDGQQFDKFINDQFSAHTLYGGQVVLTNPTSTPRSIELLIQIPQGAVVSSGSRETQTIDVDLQPFSTQSFEYSFYFPTAGDFTHFPAHVASDGKVVAVADQVAFKVVDEPAELDKESWAYVSQNGGNDQVIDFLNRQNVLRLNLSKIAFRMKDRGFFNEVIKVLRNRYVFNSTLWSYSLMHNDIDAINEYLEANDSFVSQCGQYLKSTPLTVEPVVRNWYEHREYRPLINARAHQVGKRHKILNQKFFNQYHKYMAILAHQNELDSEDRLALTYYMLLQDRIDEAVNQFKNVDKDHVAEKIQYDYCDAYLKMYLEQPDAAAAIAQTYADHPVDRWRNRFLTVLAHVEEIRGGGQNTIDDKNQTEAQTGLASKSPSFDFEIEDGTISVNHQNLSQLVVNYYLMDIELLFSRNPFGQTQGDGFSLIRPNLGQTVQLDESGKSTFEIPTEMQNQNVTVELIGKDQNKSQAYYAHQLSIQVIDKYGQLKVSGKEDGKPISKAYVKVYAKNSDGSVKFFKDGYTDLRGRFDYATQSNYPLDGVTRFSILVMSDEFGTTVRQAAPPKE